MLKKSPQESTLNSLLYYAQSSISQDAGKKPTLPPLCRTDPSCFICVTCSRLWWFQISEHHGSSGHHRHFLAFPGGRRGVGLRVSAVNSADASVATTFTFNSSNTQIATVSPGGSVCAGVWDSSFVVCNGLDDALGNPISGTAIITATAAGSNQRPRDRGRASVDNFSHR